MKEAALKDVPPLKEKRHTYITSLPEPPVVSTISARFRLD